MEYPGSHFTRPLRLIFLGAFILFFCIATPITLLYSIGYHFDWRNGFLKQAGGLSVDEITPKSDIRVYINDVRLSGGLPIRLKNITPRSYVLRLTAPGYFDWEKRLEVQNKETYYVKQVALIKKSVPQLRIPGDIKSMSISNDGRYLAYSTVTGDAQRIWVHDTQTSSTQQITALMANAALTLTWADDFTALAIFARQNSSSSLFVYNPLEPTPGSLVPLQTPNNSFITKYEWAGGATPALYLADAKHIYFVNLRTNELTPVANNTFADWAMEKNQLWTLTTSTGSNTIVVTKDTLGFSTRQTIEVPNTLTDLPLAAWHFVGKQAGFALVAAGDSSQIFVRGATAPTEITANNAAASLTSKNWWALWNSSEIWTYAAGEAPRLLSRTGNTVVRVVVLDAYNTLGIIWKNQITALSPYYSVATPLIAGEFRGAVADTRSHVLYINGTINGAVGVWSLTY